VLARAFGGSTGRDPSGWDIGLSTINLDTKRIKELFGLDVTSQVKVIEIHQDQVMRLPPDALILGSSKKTGVEMSIYPRCYLAGLGLGPNGLGSVLAMAMALSKLPMPRLIKAEIARDSIQSLEQAEMDQFVINKLCKTFLKGHPKSSLTTAFTSEHEA
ncbi:hypothetical protein AMTR_s00025p00234250, partial [Amborella trichopoda]